jgi:uncharacterized protein (DUF1810 family)
MLATLGRSAHGILGSPDDMKFRACMTLFAQLVPDEPVFGQALLRFFGAGPDERPLALLAAAQASRSPPAGQ